MSKRAIRTSRKRVEAILRGERQRIREYERKAAEYGAAFGRTRIDDNGDVWLTQKPQGRYWTVAVPPGYSLTDWAMCRGVLPSYKVQEIHFRPVQMAVRLADGRSLRWINWEACL